MASYRKGLGRLFVVDRRFAGTTSYMRDCSDDPCKCTACTVRPFACQLTLHAIPATTAQSRTNGRSQLLRSFLHVIS